MPFEEQTNFRPTNYGQGASNIIPYVHRKFPDREIGQVTWTSCLQET